VGTHKAAHLELLNETVDLCLKAIDLSLVIFSVPELAHKAPRRLSSPSKLSFVLLVVAFLSGLDSISDMKKFAGKFC
jgi:hypothetical protein